MPLFPPMTLYSWHGKSCNHTSEAVIKFKPVLFIHMLKKISGMTKSTSTQLVPKSAFSKTPETLIPVKFTFCYRQMFNLHAGKEIMGHLLNECKTPKAKI